VFPGTPVGEQFEPSDAGAVWALSEPGAAQAVGAGTVEEP
jgi:hypothetical protein